MSHPAAPRWRLNTRALATLGGVCLAIGALLAAVAMLRRGGPAGDALLRQAEAQIAARPARLDLALSYLDAHLKAHPGDVRALDHRMDLLTRVARSPEDLLEAVRTGDQALRAGPDPARARAIRKRLVELYLEVSRLVPPDQAQLATATAIARSLLEGEGRGEADAHRLLAQVLLARADQGDDAARGEAVQALEEACRLDPADATASLELARVERFDLTPPDPARADAILDRFLEAATKTGDRESLVAARLGRYRHWAQASERADTTGDRAALASRADEELRLALEAAPEHPTARLLAAESALRKGEAGAARGHFEAIPADARSDRRALTVKGLIELAAGRPEAAVAAWREGLRDQNGTDPELTWRLAGLLLELGRTTEAEPLIGQHRRLSGGPEPGPSHRYLLGLLATRQNRPEDALKELVRARQEATDPILRAQIAMAQGQAYEAMRDPAEAIDRYTEASREMPRWSNPRTARARALVAMGRAGDAMTELKAALADQPDDPALVLGLGRAQMAAELKRPAADRRWDDLRNTLERARQVAPGAGELALLEADLASLTGQGGPAAESLLQAARAAKRDVELWTAAAVALMRLGQPGPALAVLDEAARPDAVGDQGTIRIARARLLTALGRGGEARQALADRADALPPDQRAAMAAELASWHRRRGEREQARAAAARWAELAPSDPRPLQALLELDDQAGDEDAHRRHLAALEALGPVGLQAARVARVERLLREPTAAAESAADREARLTRAGGLIDELTADSSSRLATAWLRGQLAERRDRPEEAVAAYEDAMREAGGLEAAERLAVLYGRLGQVDRLEDLRRRLPEMGSALDRLATVELVARGREAEAERLAQAVATGDPESLDARLWEARVLNSVGKPEEAEQRLLALAEGSDEPGPWLALLFFQAGRKKPPAELAATVEKARARVTKVEKPELLWAQCWRIAGDATKAGEAFEAALTKWPEDPGVARGAAGFFQATGRVDRAEALLRQVATRDPSQRWAARGLALLRSARPNDGGAWEEAWKLAQGPEGATSTPEDRLTRAVVLARSPDRTRREEATRLLEALAADLPPDHPIGWSARNLLIETYAQEGRGGEARRVALALSDGTGSDPKTVALLAELALRSGQLDEAANQSAKLQALRPGDPAAAMLQARVAQARGQSAEALKACLDAVQAQNARPDDRFEAARMAVNLATDGNATDALKAQADAVLEAALKGGPDQVELLQLASYLRHVQGRFDEEMGLYRRLDALQPEAPWYLNNMAWTLSEDLGQPEAALPVIDRLLKLVGDHPSCRDTRGTILLRMGKTGPAIEEFRRAVEAEPANAVYHYHLARAYLKDGQIEAFRAQRDLARKAGLKADQLQASERAELDRLLAQ